MNTSGEVELDFLGKFENLETDFNLLKMKFNKKNVELKSKNKSNHKPYWFYYNKKTAKIVEKIYKKDIQIFQYKFPYDKI